MAFLKLNKILAKELSQSSLFADFATNFSNKIFIGMDEAGRGPWAGPLVAAALILKDEKIKLPKLNDSKLVKEEDREKLFQQLKSAADFGIGIVESSEIDAHGLTKAVNMAFERALIELFKKLKIKKFDVTTTGNFFGLIDGRDKMKLPIDYKSIIKGDQKVKQIAAASIIAKVTRDHLMIDFAKQHPEYGFDDHKGYGTERHQRALKEFGICKIHRRSYKPVMEFLGKDISN